MLDTALSGGFDGVETVEHPVFGLRFPTSCPGVESGILDPRVSWSDKRTYDANALKLRDMFRENFERHRFEDYGIEPVM